MNLAANSRNAGVPLFGVGTPTTYTATTTSGTALAANTDRRYACITNLGTETVYLAIGATAEANKGIPIRQNERYEISSENLTKSAITAITGASTSALAILEGE